MEHAGSEGGIDIGGLEHLREMLRRSGTAGGNQRHPAHGAHGAQLRDIVASAHTVARHAIEHDFARAATLCLADPVESIAEGVARTSGVPGELLHAKSVLHRLAIDADDDALGAEALAQRVDQLGPRERRRIDGHFFRARGQNFLRLLHGSDSARDAEWDVEDPCDALHPGFVHRALLRARGDVVEDELVGARYRDAGADDHNSYDDPVIAKAHALDDLSVTDV